MMSDASARESSKILRVGLLSPVEPLDPRESQDFATGMVQWQIFETPYAPPFGDDPPPPTIFREPLRFDPSPGGRTVCSAAVRGGIRFSDGTAMTPQHVAAALNGAKALVDQAEVRARGDRVVFTLKRANAHFDVALTQRYCAVVLERGGRLLGTGPYVVAPDSSPQAVHLVRNPYYDREPVKIDEILFVVHPPAPDGRPQALLDALKRGEVDFTNVLSREDLAPLRGVRKWFEPGTSTAILYFNTQRTGLRHPFARQALALAVPRNRLTRLSYTNVLAFKASGLLPPMMGYWRDGIRHDMEKARELAARPGVALPRQLYLLTVWAPRPYLPDPRPAAELIAGQLGELGVDVKVVQPASSDAYFNKVTAGNYDLALSGWIADTPDPADYLDSVLSSKLIPTVGAPLVNRANLARLDDPRMDAALADFRSNPNDRNRQQILELLRREVPLLPLMYGPTIVAHSWRVTNFRMSPLGIPFFATMDLQR